MSAALDAAGSVAKGVGSAIANTIAPRTSHIVSRIKNAYSAESPITSDYRKSASSGKSNRNGYRMSDEQMARQRKAVSERFESARKKEREKASELFGRKL